MNECVCGCGGSYWERKTEIVINKNYTVSWVGGLICMEQGVILQTGEKLKYWEKKFIQMVCRINE